MKGETAAAGDMRCTSSPPRGAAVREVDTRKMQSGSGARINRPLGNNP